MTRRAGVVGSGCVLCAALLAIFVAAHAETEQQALMPDEMIRLMEESKVHYRIGLPPDDIPRETYADQFWPLRSGVPFPYVRDGEDGRKTLENYPFGPGTEKLERKAGRFFAAEQYEKAADLYRKVIGKSPRNYRALAYLGDCYFFTGRVEEALPYYQQARSLNPDHYFNYLTLGHAYVKLGEFDKARVSFVEGLVRRPQQTQLLKLLSAYSSQLRVRVHDEPFQPRVLVRREKDEVAIYVDPDTSGYPWLNYGNCKAIWLGEAEYRRRRAGVELGQFSNTEETDCLKILAISYKLGRDDGTLREDAILERLYEITDQGLIDGFMWYEIAARVSPDLVLLLPDSEVQKVREYIQQFLVIAAGRD